MTELGKTRGNNYKAGCTVCNWKGRLSDTATSQSNDDIDDESIICPRCKTIDSMTPLCETYACWKRVNGRGQPPTTEHHFLCFEHRHKKAANTMRIYEQTLN